MVIRESDQDILRGQKLDDFDLSTRTANCLLKAQVGTIGELVALRSADILGWQNAGKKTLSEIKMLLSSVGLELSDDRKQTDFPEEKSQSDFALATGQAVTIGEGRVNDAASLCLSTAPLPLQISLASFVSELPLSVRTQNLIRKECGAIYLGELAQLTQAQILDKRGAGRHTVSEITDVLADFGLSIGTSIPDWSREKARELRGMLRTAKPSRPKASENSARSSVAHESPVPVTCEATVIEEELYNFVRLVCGERNAQILVKLWGWNGESPRTLDSVGKEFALTRERVRQIEKRALQRLRKHRFEGPLVAAAVSTLRSIVPDIDSALGAALRERGISRGKFRPESLHDAADRLGIEWPFQFVGFGEKRLLSLTGEGETYRKAVLLVRKQTSDRGCMNILSLASELQMDESKIPDLRRVLAAVSKNEWLDDSRDWLYSLEVTRNRLYNLCSKVLGVTPRVHLSELRHAVSKSRRLAMCPPQRVLRTFIERCGLGRVEESIVIANSGNSTAPAEGSAEGLMLRVLDEYGPVMDGEMFAEKCVAAGVNATTFYIYRSISPVICALGKNVYCKVGAEVPPGTVEDIIGKRRAVARISDYGWTNTERLWCGRELTRQVITIGAIALPTFVADLVQGNWQVILPDGSECGTVSCRGLFIWSFRKPFAILGAEPADLTAFEFDLKSRKVLVKVGGPGLFEAMQDSDSVISEEGPEEA